MNSSEILSNTDRTSWKRVRMVMKYFWPSLRPMVIIYPLLAVILVALMHKSGVANSNPASNTLMVATGWAIMFAPCFLSRQANGEVFYSLPALGWEKCAAIFLTMFIGVPLLFLPLNIYGIIIGKEATLSVIAAPVKFELTYWFVYLSVMSAITSQCAAIWAVFTARRHRALKAMGAVFGFMFIDGIFGFIVGFLSALSSPHDNSEQVVITDYLSAFQPYFCAFWTFAFLFVAYKASRAISRRQL